ncbi:hypothetical protein ACTHGU_11510 [Chitinophagaceae bacterium MMS25-I14]
MKKLLLAVPNLHSYRGCIADYLTLFLFLQPSILQIARRSTPPYYNHTAMH